MKEYRVQAILIDNTGRNEIETIVDSFKTTDYEKTLEFVMKRHRFCNNYLYTVMEIESQKIIFKSKENKFAVKY